MAADYDAIIVGARCAGAPTAMLLARQGYRVLVVDRASFPSDTVSTHMIHAPGIAALHRWGLLDEVTATGCPAVESYSFDFGPFTITGTPRPCEGIATGYAPRRTVLDKILVDAAARAGAEVRERFSVEDVIVEDGTVVGIRGRGDGGTAVVERARVVIGADGRNSRVAKAVQPAQYNDKPMLQWSYYTYWSDLPVDGFEIVVRPDRGWAAMPTNDGLTLLVVGWPYSESAAYKADVEANYLKTLELAPEFAERVRERHPRGALHRRSRAQLLPHALRTRLGTRRRRRLHQGPDHRPGDQRRLPRRRTVRHRPRQHLRRPDHVRSRHGRLPTNPRRRGTADLRIHDPTGHDGSATRRDAAAARSDAGDQAPWTISPASPPAPSPRPSSSTPPTSAASCQQVRRLRPGELPASPRPPV